MIKTLRHLVKEFGATAFVYADEGNGCAFGPSGQAIDYDDEADEKYGDLELALLPEPVVSNDRLHCTYASRWLVSGDGNNAYRFRILF